MILRDGRLIRIDENGAIVLLPDQDRSRWDPARLGEGRSLLEEALTRGRPGPYQLQAAMSPEAVRDATALAFATGLAARLGRLGESELPSPWRVGAKPVPVGTISTSDPLSLLPSATRLSTS